jgi:Holliday junction resolvase RusA-like endonuclease
MYTPTVFHVPGEPKPQPRTQAFARLVNGKPVARVYTPDGANDFKSRIAIAIAPYLPKTPIDRPLRLSAVFRWRRPKHHFGTGRNAGVLKADAPHFCCAHGDLDNIVKALKDAITVTRFWSDDRNVCQYGLMEAVWGDTDESWVCIEAATAEAPQRADPLLLFH